MMIGKKKKKKNLYQLWILKLSETEPKRIMFIDVKYNIEYKQE